MHPKHNLRRLSVWQEAIDLAVEVYKITRRFPVEEKFGLVSQMNRAATSIASNIAEGAGRNSDREFIQFLAIANGSANELLTQMIISARLKLVATDEFDHFEDKIDKVQRSVFNLSATLKRQSSLLNADRVSVSDRGKSNPSNIEKSNIEKSSTSHNRQ